MTEVRVPDIGDVQDVAVIEILAQPGDSVSVGQALVIVESEKASIEIPSSLAGVLRELKVRKGDKVNVGDVLAILEIGGSANVALPAAALPMPPAPPALPDREPRAPVDSDVPGPPDRPKVEFAKFGPVQRRELSRIKKISGANLHRNWMTIPHVTSHDDADITELEAFRVRLNKEFEKSSVKISILPFLVMASVAALKTLPEFNSSLDEEQLVLKQYFHIGFAADTPNGLIVPVVRDADRKGLFQIGKEMVELAEKARDGKLGAEAMTGACFTISSLGGIGGTYFTPIINAPEVAILGVGRSRMQAVWDGKQVQARLMLPLSLSWDHRVIDGAAAARFLTALGAHLSDLRRTML